MQETLDRFRRTHPPRHVDGWTYLASEQRVGPSVLILPGAIGTAESTFVHFIELETGYHVLAPSYPPVQSMRELVLGLVRILDREGIDRTAVLGGSYGAAVAQSLARHCPERVTAMILSHGGAPSPDRARRTKRFLKLLPFLPMVLLRTAASLGTARLLPRDMEDRAFWKVQLGAAFAHLTKDDFRARYACIVEYDESYRFAPNDLPRTPVLILESDDDPLVPAAERAALRAVYPSARVHTFRGAGHVSSLLRRAEYFEVVRKFLRESC